MRLAAFAFCGFAIHALLPLRHRLPFFAALSLAGTALVLGMANAAWLVGIGLVLIGICHLPIAAGFAARCWFWQPGPSPCSGPTSAAVPVVGGDLADPGLDVHVPADRLSVRPAARQGTARSRPARWPTSSCCRTCAFRCSRSWTTRRSGATTTTPTRYRIYQRGIDWMVRGVIHLILYRVVYYYLTLAPAEVTGRAELAQYLVANFLLYLRVSGQFHLIVGMLHLFGFHLPETHNRYLLASSFTDFWRRINIYWKDFMMKIFYYPAIFRLKRSGRERPSSSRRCSCSS